MDIFSYASQYRRRNIIVEGNAFQRVGQVLELGNSSNKESFNIREYLDSFLMLINSTK